MNKIYLIILILLIIATYVLGVIGFLYDNELLENNMKKNGKQPEIILHTSQALRGAISLLLFLIIGLFWHPFLIVYAIFDIYFIFKAFFYYFLDKSEKK